MKTVFATLLTSLLAAVLFTALPQSVAAKSCPHTPAPGSPARKAILDTLRTDIQPQFNQNVVFVISHFGVCGNWAFLQAEPQRPGGKPIDWSKTDYAQDVEDDMCGGLIHALLFKRAGRWTVREKVICATDVPWVTWPEEFGAPRGVFPTF
ncbi:hypothetical protein [Methyloligella solikamskensis]|uniref:Secreted protein n=1 Tax=Methyloligella solikamskensis TaxID=1177756 RepID=A0ABW3JB06_9HYPH